MKEQLNNKLYIKSMDDIYPDTLHVKNSLSLDDIYPDTLPVKNSLSLDDMYPDPLPMKDVINAEELLNECKILYNKDDLADLTKEEITNFMWIKVAEMVDIEQSTLLALINNFGW